MCHHMIPLELMGSLGINGSGMNCKRSGLAGDDEALLYYCAIFVVAFGIF